MVLHMNEEYGAVWKIVVIGDSGVGKTQLISRYARGEFQISSKATIGVDFDQRNVEINGKKFKLQIWDTAGQEKYKAIVDAYYRNAIAVVIVYDMTKHLTFQNVVKFWLKELSEQTWGEREPVLMLVGHKYDLRPVRSVTKEEGQSLASNYGMLFTEASAKENVNVEEVFNTLTAAIYENWQKERPAEIPANISLCTKGKEKKKIKKPHCCKVS